MFLEQSKFEIAGMNLIYLLNVLVAKITEVGGEISMEIHQ